MLFLRNTSRTLGLLSQLYLTRSRHARFPADSGSLISPHENRELFKRNRVYTPDDRRRSLKLELEIRNSLIRLSRLIVALHDEMSLLPVCPAAYSAWRPYMNLHSETYDAVSQHHWFHANNPRSYDRPSPNKRTYTCSRSYFKGHERQARVCTRTSSLISPGVLTHLTNIWRRGSVIRYRAYASRYTLAKTLFAAASLYRSFSHQLGTRAPR